MRYLIILLVAASAAWLGCGKSEKAESPKQYAIALKADNFNLSEGYKLRISKRGNPAYLDYIDTEER